MSVTRDEEIFTTWTNDLEDTDTSVMCLCGELDASTAPAFVSEAREIINRRRNLIMDAHLLSYVDSTGVSAIMSTRNALGAEGKELYLVGCHGLLSKILHLTRMDTTVRCLDDVESAISEIRAKES